MNQFPQNKTALPDQLILLLSAFWPDSLNSSQQLRSLKALHGAKRWLSMPDANGKPSVFEDNFILVHHKLSDLEDTIQPNDAQLKWADSGVYHQAAIVSPYNCDFETMNLIIETMTKLDNLVVSTGHILPSDIDRAVGHTMPLDQLWEPFRRQICFFDESLVEVRNRALVGMKAIELGLDPDTEYERFVQAGCKYFLDYPVLCQ